MTALNSVIVLNTIRKEATEMYKTTVPIATRQNLEKVGDVLLNPSNAELRNEFLDALIDKCAFSIIKSKMFKNPLSVFKSNIGRPYGNKIEDVFIQPSKGLDFNREIDSTIVLKTFHPDIRTAYYGMARKDTFAYTFAMANLRQAFSNDTSFMSFYRGLIVALYSGDNIAEFLCMKNCLGNTIDAGVIPYVKSNIDTPEGAKALLKNIGLYSRKFAIPSTLYCPYNEQLLITNKASENPLSDSELNAKKITPFCEKSDQVLIATSDALNEMTYEVLASTFNLSLAQVEAMTIEVDYIPSEKFRVHAVLCDKEFLQCVDHTYILENEYIKGTMKEQCFLNHWQWIWCSMFANVIMFGEPLAVESGSGPDRT